MKTPAKVFGVFAVLLLVFAGLARAEGELVCIVRPNTTVAVNTGTSTGPGADGGAPCSWAAGAVVPMQCEDCVVCYDPTASKGGVATVDDVCANFQTGALPADPILIALSSNQQKISMILASVGDAGTSCRCKMFGTTRRVLQ